MDLNAFAGSDHGIPDLLTRDMLLLKAYDKWVRIVREEYEQRDWLPSDIDWRKSRLFWRLRSGKEPLKSPPPCCYACPWYEVIEMDTHHTTFEEIRIFTDSSKEYASVAQCRYEIVQKASMEGEENAAILSFGPYQFRAWNAWHDYSDKMKRICGHIQLIKE